MLTKRAGSKWRRRAIQLGVFIAVTGMTISAASSTAAAQSDDGSRSQSDELTEISLAMADAYDVRPSEVGPLLEQEQTFTELAIRMQEKYGEDNVDVWIGREQPAEPTFHLRARTAELRNALTEEVSAEGVGYLKVEIVAADGWMHADRVAVVDEMAPKWVAADPRIEGINVDVATGEVVLGVLREDQARTALPVTGLPTRVEYTSTPASDTNRGGLTMSDCTTGFAATYSSGAKGILTAAHCNPSAWYTAGSSTAQSSTFHSQVHGANGDIEARTISSTHTLYRSVWQVGSSYTAYSGITTAVTGNGYCSKGKMTGYVCGFLYSVTFKPTYSGACPGTTCNSVFLQFNNGTIPGDSGGSVIRATSGTSYAALGIIKGLQGGLGIATKIQYRPAGWTVF